LYTTRDGNTSTQCKQVFFAETPIMSAYIVFFGIGDYQSTSMIDSGGINQTAYFPWNFQPPEQYVQYGLNDSLQVLPYFGQLFNQSFPLPKMDSISITQYKFGAMENYGAITYRLDLFVVEPELESIDWLNTVSRVIGHEIAHQWFGNLVTHRWWDHIWLKEGFATYFSYIASNYTRSEQNPWYHFYVRNMNGIMLSDDSSIFIRPIVRTVMTPQEIRDVYDGIVYDKAGSIIFHLRNYCKMLLDDKDEGDALFYGALRNYLLKWQINSTVSEDLFDQFDILMGNEIISQFMTTWVYNAGYPVLYVDMEEIDEDSMTITLRQQRFVKEGPLFYEDNEYRDNPYYDPAKAAEFAKQIWQIPIQFEMFDGIIIDDVDAEILGNKLLTQKNVTITMQRWIANDDGAEFYIFNPNQEHYYRVIYDDYLFSLIEKNFETFSDLNQFNIISDLYQEMLSGYISPVTYLQFIATAWNRDNYNVYINDPLVLMHDIIIDSLLQIDSMLCGLDKNDKLRDNFREYARNLLSPIMQDMGGWNSTDDDSEEIIRLRSELLNAMIIFDDNDIIQEGEDILLDAITNENGTLFIDLDSLDPNLLQQYFSAALGTLGSGVYDTVLDIFFDDNYNSLQSVILNAFGAVYQNEDLTQATIDLLLYNSELSASQTITGLSSFTKCYGRDSVWDNLMFNNSEKWKYLYRFSSNQMVSFADTVSSIDKYNNIYSFYFENEEIYNLTNGDSNFRVNETLENIYMNVQWINTNYDVLQQYLVESADDSSWWDDTGNVVLFVFLLLAGLIIILVMIYCFKRKRNQRMNLQPLFGGQKNQKYSEMAENNDEDTGYGATK